MKIRSTNDRVTVDVSAEEAMALAVCILAYVAVLKDAPDADAHRQFTVLQTVSAKLLRVVDEEKATQQSAQSN